MSPHSVPSFRFRLVFLILAAVWCRELVFRQPCCVFTLCLDSSLITTIHLCCSSKSLCHSSPSYHCLLFIPLGYLIKYQNSLATCFLLFTMTERSDQSMEAASASANSLEAFITQSINRMDSQEVSLSNTGRAIQALVAQVVRAHPAISTSASSHCATHTASSLHPTWDPLPVGTSSARSRILFRWTQFLQSIPHTMFHALFSATQNIQYWTNQGCLYSDVIDRKSGIMGNSGVGEPKSMLRLVPGTLRWDEAGVRSCRRREGGGQNTRRPSSGWEIGLWLLHRVPDLSGRVSLERGVAVGHVSAWAGWPRPEGDLRPGPPHYTQWTHWSGTKGRCTTG